jgi:hypothetical protein
VVPQTIATDSFGAEMAISNNLDTFVSWLLLLTMRLFFYNLAAHMHLNPPWRIAAVQSARALRQ